MRAAALLVLIAACASSADATSVTAKATTDTAAEVELRAATRTKTFGLDGSGKGVRFYPPISDPGAIEKLEVSATTSGFALVRAATNGEPAISTSTLSTRTPIVSTTLDDWDPLASGAPGAGAAVEAHHNVSAVVAWYHDVLGWTTSTSPSGHRRHRPLRATCE